MQDAKEAKRKGSKAKRTVAGKDSRSLLASGQLFMAYCFCSLAFAAKLGSAFLKFLAASELSSQLNSILNILHKFIGN